MIERILHRVDGFSDRSGAVIGVFVYGMLASLLIEVALRYVFNRPTIWAHEVSAYFFGAYFMLAAAYCLRHKGHIAVDVLYIRLSTRKRAILDVITSSFFLFVCIILIWYGGITAWDSWHVWEHSNSTFGPPLYPLKTVIPIGAFMLLIQGLAKLTRDVAMAFAGRELGQS